MFKSVRDKDQSQPQQNLEQLSSKRAEISSDLAQAKDTQMKLGTSLSKLQNSIREAGKDARNAKEGIYTPAQKEVYRAFAAKQKELLHTTKKDVEQPLTLRGHRIAKAEAAHTSAGAKLLPQRRVLGFLWKKSLNSRIEESNTKLNIAKKISSELKLDDNKELKLGDKKIDQTINKIQVKANRLAELSKETITALDGISKQKRQIDQQIRSWSNTLPQMDKPLAEQILKEIALLRGCKKDLIELEKVIKSIGFSTVNAEDTKKKEGEEKDTLNAYDRQMKSLREDLVGNEKFPGGKFFAIEARINGSITVGKGCETKQKEIDEFREKNKLPLQERLFTRIYGYTSTPIVDPGPKKVSIHTLNQLIEFRKPIDKIDVLGTLKDELARADENIEKAKGGSVQALDDLYDLFVALQAKTSLISEIKPEVDKFQAKMVLNFPQINLIEGYFHLKDYWKQESRLFLVKQFLDNPSTKKATDDARKALANPNITAEDKKLAEEKINRFTQKQNEFIATEKELIALEEKLPTIEAKYPAALKDLPRGKLYDRLDSALKMLEKLPHSSKGEYTALSKEEIDDLERGIMSYQSGADFLKTVSGTIELIFGKNIPQKECDATRFAQMTHKLKTLDPDNADRYDALQKYVNEFESIINDAHSTFYTLKAETKKWVQKENMTGDQIISEYTRIQARLNKLKEYQYLRLPSNAPIKDSYEIFVGLLNEKVDELRKNLLKR